MKTPIPKVKARKRCKYSKYNRRKPIAPPTMRFPDLKSEEDKRGCRSKRHREYLAEFDRSVDQRLID